MCREYETRVNEMIEGLVITCSEGLPLTPAVARRMLLQAECLGACLQAYLFKTIMEATHAADQKTIGPCARCQG